MQIAMLSSKQGALPLVAGFVRILLLTRGKGKGIETISVAKGQEPRAKSQERHHEAERSAAGVATLFGLLSLARYRDSRFILY